MSTLRKIKPIANQVYKKLFNLEIRKFKLKEDNISDLSDVI